MPASSARWCCPSPTGTEARRAKTPLEDEYAKVQAENDWVVQQMARYPERLVPFCGVNPLKDYALQELERCATMPRSRA